MWAAPVIALGLLIARRRARRRTPVDRRPGCGDVAAVAGRWPISPPGRTRLRNARSPATSAIVCATSRARSGDSSRTWSRPADHWLVPDNYPGGSARRPRAPDIADQHRIAAALDGRGRRLRLSRDADRDRAARAHDGHARSAPAVSRALLQLVRHPIAVAARARVCVDGRQRQPRRLPRHVENRGARARQAALHRSRMSRRDRRRRSSCRDRRSIRSVEASDADGTICSSCDGTSRRFGPSSRACGDRRRRRAGTACSPTSASGWHWSRRAFTIRKRFASRPNRMSVRSAKHTTGSSGRRRPSPIVRPPSRQFAPWLETIQPSRRATAGPRAGAVRSHRMVRPAVVRIACPDNGHAIGAWIEPTRQRAVDLIERAGRIANRADDLLKEMDFTFLFDQQRQLFAIGYNVPEGRLDASYYDTLASEARLASFLAIAFGQVTPEHWFRLGRSLCPVAGSRALLSWSASMFEYLMPLLVMHAYRETLLDETYSAVIARQIQYGADRGVPWGISESAYNVQDLGHNYQYRAFGVPGLGLKRGLADDLVVAPYATLIATPLRPHEAIRNLARAVGGRPRRPVRLLRVDRLHARARAPDATGAGVIVRTYMAHHQGMSLLALDNCLNDDPMPRRFHADPRVQAADLLLQEKVPELVPLTDLPVETVEHVPATRRLPVDSVRRYTTPHTLSPRAHFLSNGSYSVMITNAGGGYSRWRQMAVTRWREDITTDAWGSFCYVRNLATGEVWSTTHQPTGREPLEFEVTFALDRAVFRRRDFDLEIYTELTRVNRGRRRGAPGLAAQSWSRGRTISISPATPRSCSARTAPTSRIRRSASCSSRPRSPRTARRSSARGGPAATSRACTCSTSSAAAAAPARRRSYETDRAQFIGRGGTVRQPAALAAAAKLSRTTGAVLDPIVSLRQKVRVPPGEIVRLTFATGVAADRRARPSADREVSRSTRRITNDGAGQHAREHRTASPRPDDRGNHAVPAARWTPAVRRQPSQEPVRHHAQPSPAARAVEARHLRRPSHSGRTRRRRHRAAASAGNCCRRTSIFGSKASRSIWCCSTNTPMAIDRNCTTSCSDWSNPDPSRGGSIAPAAYSCARSTRCPPTSRRCCSPLRREYSRVRSVRSTNN